MKRVLVASKSCGSGLGKEGVRKLFQERGIEATMAPLKEAMDQLEEFDGIVVGMDPFGAAEFDRAKRLKVVMKFGVGVENIDQECARQRGIAVKNMPGVNNEAVAEMAFALMISAARKVAQGDRCVRTGLWPRLLGTSLKGKTLGIVGTGAIGRTRAGYSTGFQMRLLGYDPFPNQAFEQMGGEYVPFDTLLEQADFVSIHVPLLDSTYHLFNQSAFCKMKPTAILINTARGPVVDEAALKQALLDGQLAGAGLDVFEHEPALDSPLMGMDQVVTTPHIAASSRETMEKMDRLCVQTMADALTQPE